jgi:hypothetical protein
LYEFSSGRHYNKATINFLTSQAIIFRRFLPEGYDLLFCYGKYIIRFSRQDAIASCEPAKGRQYAITFGKIKTGQPHGLLSLPFHHYYRMYMAGKRKVPAGISFF